MTAFWALQSNDNDPQYAALAETFRPVFARIREGAQAREQQRELLFEPLQWLKAVRFGALRVPVAAGGYGASLPQFFALLTELSAADSNITQALRGHFGFVESVLASADVGKQSRWFARLAQGDWVGNAWSEPGDAKQGTFTSQIVREGEHYRLNGKKYYTTGSLYADWINTGVSDEQGVWVNVVVNRHAEGVTVEDDWDGFGQRLTASGTTLFADAPVQAEELTRHESATSYDPAFYQLVHLATLTGIGLAAAQDVAQAVRTRTRSYSHGNGARAAQDPQILQIVGEVYSAVYGANAIVVQGARALQQAFDAIGHAEAADRANQQAELAIAQGQTVVSALILDAVTRLFDALGASATSSAHGLDRYWRNARTLVSHNPRVYKARIVGDYAVNGTPPGYQWRIGTA